MKYFFFFKDSRIIEIDADQYHTFVAASAAAAAAEADPGAAGLADAWLTRHEGESVMMLVLDADG